MRLPALTAMSPRWRRRPHRQPGELLMLAMLLNTFQVDLQAGEPPFPDVRGYAPIPGEQALPEM